MPNAGFHLGRVYAHLIIVGAQMQFGEESDVVELVHHRVGNFVRKDQVVHSPDS